MSIEMTELFDMALYGYMQASEAASTMRSTIGDDTYASIVRLYERAHRKSKDAAITLSPNPPEYASLRSRVNALMIGLRDYEMDNVLITELDKAFDALLYPLKPQDKKDEEGE